jgi:hypothetical protein
MEDVFKETPKIILETIEDIFYEYDGYDPKNTQKLKGLIIDVIDYTETSIGRLEEEEKKSEYIGEVKSILTQLKQYNTLTTALEFKQLIDDSVIQVREKLIALKNKR